MWSRIRKETDGAGLATDLQDAWGKDEARQGFYGLRLKGDRRSGAQEGQHALVYPPQGRSLGAGA